jgi:diguanylate cyclase (GGDEF)-like protein
MPELVDAAREQPQRGSQPSAVLAARTGGLIFLAAVLMCATAAALPHSPQTDTLGYGAVAVGCAPIAFVLLAFPRLIPARFFPLVTLYGTLLVTALIYFNGEQDGAVNVGGQMTYIWSAMYAAYFYTRRQVIAQVAAVAVATATVMLIVAPPAAAISRTLFTVVTTAVVATTVHLLRQRVDRLVQQLDDAARTDPLTGLLNRRGFEERFDLELERARRTDQPLVLLVGDLDHFKALNDRLGHPAGDAALQEVAEVLRRLGRRIDTAARLGGEEFALIAPATGADGGLVMADRLREEVARHGVQELTISFGVAAFPAHGTTAEALAKASDLALYAAKAGGRDRVVVTPDARLSAIAAR